MQQTHVQRASIHSAYTRKEPPPSQAPPGVAEVTAWELAARQWREHLPDALLGVECVVCRAAWPCDAWGVADDLLNGCRAAAEST